jgi:hypothetical protein
MNAVTLFMKCISYQFFICFLDQNANKSICLAYLKYFLFWKLSEYNEESQEKFIPYLKWGYADGKNLYFLTFFLHPFFFGCFFYCFYVSNDIWYEEETSWKPELSVIYSLVWRLYERVYGPLVFLIDIFSY